VSAVPSTQDGGIAVDDVSGDEPVAVSGGESGEQEEIY
jgi:hypothetical protein